jgi:polyhydroxybutyrate depolymerase
MGNRIVSWKFHLVVFLAGFSLLAACQRPDALQVTGVPSADEPLAFMDFTASLGPDGDQRDVILHFAPQYDGTNQLPLIIVLHGGGGSGEQVQRQSGMDQYADEYGFVVAYPNGSGRLEDAILTWNSGHCCGYALSHLIDDVGFLSNLIDTLIDQYAIDPGRVYLSGLSNGAMMSYRAGAELSGKVAGIAPIAGTLGGQIGGTGPVIVPGAPSEPVSVIAFHGMQDSHVLYAGGIGEDQIDAGRADLPVSASIDFWVSANHCDPSAQTETQANGNIIVDTYSGCDAGVEVVLVTIVDGLHAWPGGRRALLDEPTQDISANQLMLEFFLAHPKR